MFFHNKNIPNEIFPNNGPQSGGAGGSSPLINTQVPEGVTLQGSGGGRLPVRALAHNFVRLSKVRLALDYSDVILRSANNFYSPQAGVQGAAAP